MNHSTKLFREAMRQLAATVSIVTTAHEGRRFGMTATSVTSLSMDPPSLLVCVNRAATIHSPIRARGQFWVNILHKGQEAFCSAFSGGRDGEARFDLGQWRPCERGIPFLADAQASVLCEVEKTCDFSTHTIFIGRVLETRLSADDFPLVYLNGDFAALQAST